MRSRDIFTGAALMLAVFGVCQPGRAQSGSGSPPQISGFERSGRHIGFTPAHLQTGPTSPSAPYAMSGGRYPVAGASYLEDSAADEVEPQAESGKDLFSADGASCTTDVCGPLRFRACPSVWAEAEYLVWWTQGANAPPLATTCTGAPPTTAGVLGEPGTSVLFGNTRINDDAKSGGRFVIGTWLDACHCRGIQAGYLFLGQENDSFQATGSDFPTLAQPFFNSNPSVDAQDAYLVAYPGIASGTLAIAASTRLQSFECLLRRLEWQSDTVRIDGLLGYRYAELQDRVRIDSSTLILSGPSAGSTVSQFDDFATRSAFNGGVLGAAMNWHPNPWWSTELIGKAALGATRARTHVNGQTTSTTSGLTSTSTGGLLAQPTNIGIHNQDEFSVLSEFTAKLRRDFANGFSATFGYTILYWSSIARAAEQINLNVNGTQKIPPGTLIGPAQPAFPFQASGFWAQGMNFGLEYNY